MVQRGQERAGPQCTPDLGFMFLGEEGAFLRVGLTNDRLTGYEAAHRRTAALAALTASMESGSGTYLR
jgi:hypothetical protein